MTQQSLGSIVGRSDLIRKIRIPRWTIVFSSSISAVINLGLNMIVVVVAMIINKVDIMETAFLIPLTDYRNLFVCSWAIIVLGGRFR